MKHDEAALNAERPSKGNPSVGRQAFSKVVFLWAVALGHLTLCVGCAHLTEKPVLVVFETELGNITVAVDVAHAPITGKNFLRYGQSNMEGHGGVKTLDRLGEHPTHGYPLPTRVAFDLVQLARAGDVEDRVRAELKHH